MKKCFKCGIEKELDEFYKHPQMADGHVNKCKECNKRDVQENYRARRPKYQAYERKRNQAESRRKAKKVYQQLRRERHPEKDKAHVAVGNAVRDGRLIRKPCEVCGNPRVQGHHDDYSKPLDVRWLCFVHHREVHGQKADPLPERKAA